MGFLTYGLLCPFFFSLGYLQPISWLSSCPAILLCHSCYNDLILSGLFGSAVYSFPNGLTRPWAFLLMGSYVPFVFLWASLAHLLVLDFLGPFTNFVFSWAFTDFIGFSRPNYFILIIGVYRPVINPLLSLLALLWACRGLFLLFFTSYTAHGFATLYCSLSELFWSHLLSQGPFTYFMDLWSIISAT